MECPCCSGQNYDQCCQPVISGQRQATTAEQLMRSRYTAYALGEIDWIVDSQLPEVRQYTDRKATEEWSRRSTWKGLEIVETKDGGPEDLEGLVEFKASYEVNGEVVTHHEIASFRKEGDAWYFVDGLEVKPRPWKRMSAKIGPNAPCSCGSGKKYKKCCGKPGALG